MGRPTCSHPTTMERRRLSRSPRHGTCCPTSTRQGREAAVRRRGGGSAGRWRRRCSSCSRAMIVRSARSTFVLAAAAGCRRRDRFSAVTTPRPPACGVRSATAASRDLRRRRRLAITARLVGGGAVGRTVRPESAGRGGAAMIAAGLELVPYGEWCWAQVAAGNTRSRGHPRVWLRARLCRGADHPPDPDDTSR